MDAKPAGSPPVLALLTYAWATTASVPADVPLLCVTAEDRRDADGLVFSLFPGAAERARALANYATAHGLGQPVVVPADASDDMLTTWRDAGVKAALLSGLEPKLAGFGARARAFGWNPWQLWIEQPPAAATDRRAVTVESVSLSMIPADALANYRRWAALHALPAGDLQRQFAMLSSARLLAEALKGAGRELSREKLVAALEAVRSFQTGLTPPLGFSPRRHTATNTVCIVPLVMDATSPAPEWIPVE